MAESSLNPLNMTGTKSRQWKSGSEYAADVNTGKYDQYSFAHDGIAFGLAQWLYWSRKQALHEYAKGLDIGSVEVQVGYLFEELPKYKTVWDGIINAEDIGVVSDLIMLRYEKPGTITETAKQKRRDYALRFFDTYTDPNMSVICTDPINAPPTKKGVVLTKVPKLLVRCGNGKEFVSIGRIEQIDSSFPWIATSENNWHAIKFNKQVGWVSGEYAEVIF